MSRWILPKNISPAPIRLFCFPYAGGGASVFRAWSKDPRGGIFAIQPPGRENRLAEPLLYALNDIVAGVVDAVMPYTMQPYALFGHSLGARVAFETVRAIRNRKGRMPVRLFVSGSPAPERREPRPLHQLDDEAFVAELQRFSGTPVEVLNNKEIMAFFLPMLRADFTVDETYEYQPGQPLSVPITAFCGTEDPETTPDEMEGWKRHTDATFDLQLMRGGHFFLNNPENRLLDRIYAILASDCACGVPV